MGLACTCGLAHLLECSSSWWWKICKRSDTRCCKPGCHSLCHASAIWLCACALAQIGLLHCARGTGNAQDRLFFACSPVQSMTAPRTLQLQVACCRAKQQYVLRLHQSLAGLPSLSKEKLSVTRKLLGAIVMVIGSRILLVQSGAYCMQGLARPTHASASSHEQQTSQAICICALSTCLLPGWHQHVCNSQSI